MRVDNVREPLPGFSEHRQKPGRQIERHFGHGAGIFPPAKGKRAHDFYLVAHLTPGKMAHSSR